MKLNISHSIEGNKNNSCTSIKNGSLTIPFNQSQYVENVIIQVNNFSKGQTRSISLRAFH